MEASCRGWSVPRWSLLPGVGRRLHSPAYLAKQHLILLSTDCPSPPLHFITLRTKKPLLKERKYSAVFEMIKKARKKIFLWVMTELSPPCWWKAVWVNILSPDRRLQRL